MNIIHEQRKEQIAQRAQFPHRLTKTPANPPALSQSASWMANETRIPEGQKTSLPSAPSPEILSYKLTGKSKSAVMM